MEKPKAYVQTDESGKLESTQHAIDVAKKAKQQLDSLHGDLDSMLPPQGEMTTGAIEISEQSELSEKGLLAILAENCPALADAFQDSKFAVFAYGHIFHALKEQGVDANALPVVEGKPIQLHMENGHVRMNVPNLEGPDGQALYNNVEFDLYPWGQNNEIVQEKDENAEKLAQIPSIEETDAQIQALVESYGIDYKRREDGNIVYTMIVDYEGNEIEAGYHRWSKPGVKRMEDGVDFYEQYRQQVAFQNPELFSIPPNERQPYFERLDKLDEYTSVKSFLEIFNDKDRLATNG